MVTRREGHRSASKIRFTLTSEVEVIPERWRPIEQAEILVQVMFTLKTPPDERARFDAETLIGFYRYFPFPLAELLPVFGDYHDERIEAAWSKIDAFFGGPGATGVPAEVIHPVPPRHGTQAIDRPIDPEP